MSKLPRFINVSVPDYYGVMHTLDWMRADIANDLLEALELIVMERAWFRDERPDGYNIEDRLNAWEETARAAIAKAKGEQQ